MKQQTIRTGTKRTHKRRESRKMAKLNKRLNTLALVPENSSISSTTATTSTSKYTSAGVSGASIFVFVAVAPDQLNKKVTEKRKLTRKRAKAKIRNYDNYVVKRKAKF